MSTEEFFWKIDWELLREQKGYCVNEAANNKDAYTIYDGIVALIDALQDHAVEKRFCTETEVFGDEVL